MAEADLMTLLRGREDEVGVGWATGVAGVTGGAGVTGVSVDSRRWRARRAARSLMALVVEGASLLEAVGGAETGSQHQQGDRNSRVTITEALTRLTSQIGGRGLVQTQLSLQRQLRDGEWQWGGAWAQ